MSVPPTHPCTSLVNRIHTLGARRPWMAWLGRGAPWLIAAFLLSLGADALAQPRAARRTVRPTAPTTRTPGPSTRVVPPVDRRMCASRERVLSSEERRLGQEKADLAGVEAEIEQLRARLVEMRRRQLALTQRVAMVEVRLETKRQAYHKECQSTEDCGLYERLTDDLERSAAPIEQAISRVRSEIGDTRRSVGTLRRRIDPIRREYKQKACSRLVPGQTAQSTIDRCTDLFSQWNRLQGELNQHNRRLPAMNSRYQQQLAQLGETERRAAKYEEYLGRNCRRSSRLAKVRRYRGMRDRARGLKRDLEDLINEVKSLKAIRIHD